MAQILRPNGSTLGNYTVTGAATAHEAVDEVTLSTADYVESPESPVDEPIDFIAPAATDPNSTATHSFSVVAYKNVAGGGTCNLTLAWYRTAGGSEVLVASVVHPDISETPTVYTLTLTPSQIATITQADYEKTGTGSLLWRATATQV